MSFAYTLSKKWILLSVLATFVFVGIRSTDVFADTSASADGTATITVHVLESGADTPDQDEPVPDPDPEEYIEPEIDDDGSTASTVIKDFCNRKLTALNKTNANVIDFYNHETERAGIQANGINFGNFKMKLFNIDRDSSSGRINYNKYRENLNSIGMKVTHTPSSKTAFLAADWEWGVEDKYGSAIGKVDILKAGHHGVRTSNSYEFIKALNPKTVLVTSQNMANSNNNGLPNRQPAAWAYVEQTNGSVYFTGDSTGAAVAISLSNNNYEAKKGQEHSTLADANTDSTPRQTGPYTMRWGGGLTGWVYPANKDGSGGNTAYRAYKSKYYVYVYKSKSSAGNIISQIDRCINGYTYKFSSSFDNGVANGRVAGCNSQ